MGYVMRKTNNDGFRVVLCLAATVIAIATAAVSVAKMDNLFAGLGESKKEVAETIPTGNNEKIKEAYKNTDGTYTVAVTENGYVGEMILELVYDKDGQTLVSYKVVSHTETDGIGTKALDKSYQDTLTGVKLPIMAADMEESVAAILGIEVPKEESKDGLKDGTYKVQADPDADGNYAFVEMVVAGGRITSVVWDELYNGELKSVLSLNGQYDMYPWLSAEEKKDIPVWAEQAEAMGAYVVEHQGVEGLNLNENGKTDVVSGVSVSVGGFTALVKEAMQHASVVATEPETAPWLADVTTVDVVSGATFTSKAVIRAIDEGYVFLRDYLGK